MQLDQFAYGAIGHRFKRRIRGVLAGYPGGLEGNKRFGPGALITIDNSEIGFEGRSPAGIWIRKKKRLERRIVLSILTKGRQGAGERRIFTGRRIPVKRSERFLKRT